MTHQAYSVLKDGSSGNALTVSFDQAFAKPPIIFVSAFLDGSSGGVGSIETITDVSTTSVTITSGNRGSSYFVNVLAIDPDAQHIGGMPISVGTVPKPNFGVTVPVLPPVPSINLVTPWWPSGVVGYVDTVAAQNNTAGGGSKLAVVSGNQGSTFNINVLSAAPGGFGHIESGQVNKTGGGTQRVYFTTPFVQPPVVLVGPRFDGASAATYVDTITKVTTSYFDVTSNNSGSAYFVNWVAVPPYRRHRERMPDDRFQAAFTKMQTIMPTQADQMALHYEQIHAHIVLKRTPPSAVFDIGYGLATLPPPMLMRTNPSNCTEMVARCIFDVARLALSIAGLTIDYSDKMAAAAISVVAGANLSKYQTLIQAYHAADGAWAKAGKFYNIVEEFYNSDGFSAIIRALTEELSWWDWVVTGISVLAEVGAWFATDGALFIAKLTQELMSYRTLPHNIALCFEACVLS